MTGLSRKLRRAKARKTGTEWPTRQRPYRDSRRTNAVTGYDTLHPTNGWQRIGQKRLRAQARLRAIVEIIAARRGRLNT